MSSASPRNLEMNTAEVCAVSYSYESTGVYSYAWDGFATAFVSLIGNHVPQERMMEIGDFFFGQATFSEGAYDLLLSQPSFLIIFWIGVLLCALSLAGAIAMLIPCARNWNTKKISSKTMAITGTALAVVSFAFIVTGIVLYSISHFESGYPRDDQPMETVKKNINSFMSTTTQNDCFARSAFDPIYNQNNEIPNSIGLNFIEKTGLLGMESVNCTELSIQLSNNLQAVDDIVNNLDTVSKIPEIASDPIANEEMAAALKQFQDIQTQLTTGMPDKVKQYGKDVDDFMWYMEDLLIRTAESTIIDLAARSIDTLYYNVNISIASASSAMEDTSEQITHAASQIGYGLDGASEVVSSRWIYYRWFLFAPLIFALIASLIAISSGCYFSFNKALVPIKGSGCGLMILGVVTLAMTSVVMVPAIVGMTFGYGTQTSFDPYFYDYNLKGLHASTQILPNLTIYGNTGSKAIASFADMMVTCKREKTPFFNAIVSNDPAIINITVFANAINIADLLSMFDGQIDMDLTSRIDESKQKVIYEFLSSAKNTPDLTTAKGIKDQEISDIYQEINAWQDTLEPYLDQWLAAYQFTYPSSHGAYYFTNLTEIPAMKTIIDGEMDDILIDLSHSTQDAGKALQTDLYTNGESCGNLFRNYKDAGDLATVAMAGQVQGMWTAAGLVALFFIPLAISLLCIGNAFRHGEARIPRVPVVAQPTKASDHASAPPPPAPVAEYHPHPQPVVYAAPTAAPAAAVPMRVVAPTHAPARSEAAAPTVPLRTTSNQKSQPVLLQPVYLPPPQQPTFVDPLAYPKPRVNTTLGSYEGGPANGYYGEPSSRH